MLNLVLSLLNIPNINNSICTTARHQTIISVPSTPQQISLKIMRHPRQASFQSRVLILLPNNIRSDVPHVKCLVHGIGEQIVTTVTHWYASYGVSVAEESCVDLVLAETDWLDWIVQSSTIYMGSIMRHNNGSDLVSQFEWLNVVAHSLIPHLDSRIITGTD